MEIITLFILSLVTFITRLTNLLNIPIFTDEAIYIRWAQIGLNDPANRYISLTDGKQPLLTWLMYPFLMIFHDPLFAGRFVSVLVSVFSGIGIYLLAKLFFTKKIALISSILYIIIPFYLLYDRLALMDSLLSMFCIWSIYLSILSVKFQRLDVALINGIIIGLGLLTKSSALFFILLLPAGLLLMDYSNKKWKNLCLKWICLFLLTVLIAQVMYNSLRLSPWFYLIEQKNYTFVFTISEFLQDPFSKFFSNLNTLLIILSSYLTIPIDILVLIGIFIGIRKRDLKIGYLLLWFIVPLLALSAFGKVIYPRFMLFMSVPLLVIAAYALDRLINLIKNKKLVYVLWLLVIIYPLFQSGLILFNPKEVSIPSSDRNQLFDDWPSGYGVNEVIYFIEKQSRNGKVVIGTEGTFGLFPAVFEIYLGTNKNIEIYGFWPVNQVPSILLEKSKQYPTYLVFKEKQIVPDDWPIKLVAKYQRGTGNTYLLFYQVKPVK